LTSAATRVDLTVTPVNDAPVLQPVANLSVAEGDLVSIQLVASDIDNPSSTLSYVLDTAPTGAAVDASGRLSWRASDGDADVAFTLHAVDAAGAASASRSMWPTWRRPSRSVVSRRSRPAAATN
jgi:hypothetical protein